MYGRWMSTAVFFYFLYIASKRFSSRIALYCQLRCPCWRWASTHYIAAAMFSIGTVCSGWCEVVSISAEQIILPFMFAVSPTYYKQTANRMFLWLSSRICFLKTKFVACMTNNCPVHRSYHHNWISTTPPELLWPSPLLNALFNSLSIEISGQVFVRSLFSDGLIRAQWDFQSLDIVL